MEKITKLLESLNLLYYEYDATTSTLFVDKDAIKENAYDEMIKITYTLSKEDLDFFVDNKKNIILFVEDRFSLRWKKRFYNLLQWFNNITKNIYILSDKKIKYAKNLLVIEAKYKEQKVDLQGYDALIFTSKNGVKALDSINKDWKKIPSYAIAPQTGKVIKALGGDLRLVGKEHHGDQFGDELISKLEGKKVLYAGGSKTVSNLVSILKENGIECEVLTVYETVCKEYKKKIKLPKNSIIIFSSPSTIECFLKNVTWCDTYRAISIGETTKKFFPEYIKPLVAQNTSLESCVKKALELH